MLVVVLNVRDPNPNAASLETTHSFPSHSCDALQTEKGTAARLGFTLRTDSQASSPSLLPLHGGNATC